MAGERLIHGYFVGKAFAFAVLGVGCRNDRTRAESRPVDSGIDVRHPPFVHCFHDRGPPVATNIQAPSRRTVVDTRECPWRRFNC